MTGPEKQDLVKVGLIHPREFLPLNERLFVNYLKQTLIWSMCIVLLLASVISLLFARIFTKPIIELSKFTQQLAQGNYGLSINVNSRDELASLAGDVNLLSQSLKKHQHSQQTWIADISHELRTPVAVLQAQIEAMLDGIRSADNTNLQLIQSEIAQLSRLISDLNTLSLSDLGALNYEFTELSLSDCILDIIEQHQLQLSNKQLKVSKHLPAESIIIADHHRIKQLLGNLMQNSLRYTQDRGELNIMLDVWDQHIVLNWQDSSPGVTDQQLPKLFKRLYRTDESRNRQLGGSGLGLAICENIVHAHRGIIKAKHSHLGGLCIEIHLPLASQTI